MFGKPEVPALPPPPPSTPHFANASAAGQAYKSMQRGGLAGSILTSGQGTPSYGQNTSAAKSLLGQ